MKSGAVNRIPPASDILDAVMRRPGWWIVLVVLPWAAGCGGDPEQNLLSLPERMAAHLRAGEIDEALGFLADDFKAHGLNRHEFRAALAQDLRRRWKRVHVTSVTPDPDVEDADVRRLTISGSIGSGVAGEPVEEALVLEVTVRPDGRDWKVVTARRTGRFR